MACGDEPTTSRLCWCAWQGKHQDLQSLAHKQEAQHHETVAGLREEVRRGSVLQGQPHLDPSLPQLDVLTGQYTSLESAASATSRELEETQGRFAQLREEYQRLETSSSAVQDALQGAESSAQAMQAERDTLRCEVEQLRATATKLRQSVQDRKAEISGLVARELALQETVSARQTEVTELRSLLRDSEKQAADQKQALLDLQVRAAVCVQPALP